MTYTIQRKLPINRIIDRTSHNLFRHPFRLCVPLAVPFLPVAIDDNMHKNDRILYVRSCAIRFVELWLKELGIKQHHDDWLF